MSYVYDPTGTHRRYEVRQDGTYIPESAVYTTVSLGWRFYASPWEALAWIASRFEVSQ